MVGELEYLASTNLKESVFLVPHSLYKHVHGGEKNYQKKSA